MTADSTWLRVDDQDVVRTITIDRPERRNAIRPDGWAVLAAAFRDFESSHQRVLVVRGAGGDFCAGADVGDDPRPPGVAGGKEQMKVTGSAALALHRISKPTIAVVDGVAVGAGMNLALGCDVVIATTRARFAEIFVRRGLTLDFGGSWLLPRVVGLQRAKDLALSGRLVDAAEALHLGLCLDVAEPDDLEERVAEQVERFLSGAPVAQMFAKQGIDHSWDVSFEDALDWEGQSQAICFTTSDFIEGVLSFQQKRPPDFQGR
jgi:enoyl-CoA hydratase/carnithine racemase